MIAELVFVTHFLGLVAGERTVVLEADATVRSMELLRDGRSVARLAAGAGPPWIFKVDLGDRLVPQELTAIGFDEKGHEIARASQILNLMRPSVELDIVIDRNSRGAMSARLLPVHIRDEPPVHARVRLDGKILQRKGPPAAIPLGRIDLQSIHVLSAEVVFGDGERARKEVVFGGVYAEQMPAELTPVGVRLQPATAPETPCSFRVGEREVVASAVEEGRAVVTFIVNGDTTRNFRSTKWDSLQHHFALPDTELRMILPVVARKLPGAEVETRLFPTERMPMNRGLQAVLLNRPRKSGVLRVADAVALAGVGALSGGRRAVVVVIGSDALPDRSAHDTVAVRDYLARIGVPLRVWSTTGPRPDLATSWGDVRDISTTAMLREATNELRNELVSQRVAWIPASPIEAFRTVTSAGCGFKPLASAQP